VGLSARRYRILLASISLASPLALGCGGSLATPDGGPGAGGSSGSGGSTGSGGAGGTGLDATVPPDLQSQLDAAKLTWAAAKSSCPIYSYDRRTASVFGGATSTEVEIRNDVATRRRYWTYAMGAGLDAGYAWMLRWDETGNLVGSHGSGNFPPSTTEQLLAECETILARDPTANQLLLTIDGRGVPTTCTYRPNECLDDCVSGIEIAAFACAALTDAEPGAPKL
jgi:hypothetical protein